MSWKTARIVGLAALVAALLGGGVATARSLITGSQIKNGTITSSDIKKGGVALNRLSKGTQKLIRKSGATGATGPAGPKGATGATGPAGAKGADGASGDPTPFVITDQNWTIKGFGRWRDADDDSTIAFGTDGVTMGSPTGKRFGINFPVQQGTRVADFETLSYTGNSTFALEVDPTGDDSAAPNYATFVYVPTSTSATVSHNTLTDANWFTTRDLGTIKAYQNGGTADHKLSDLLAAANPTGTAVDNKVRVLVARIGGGSSTSTSGAISNTVSSLQTKIKGTPANNFVFKK